MVWWCRHSWWASTHGNFRPTLHLSFSCFLSTVLCSFNHPLFSLTARRVYFFYCDSLNSFVLMFNIFFARSTTLCQPSHTIHDFLTRNNSHFLPPISFLLQVGIVFAKMTRPKNRTQTLLFSKYAVICQRDGELTLMFRVGDMRKSHIIGANVRAQLIKTKMTKEGEVMSQYQIELDLGSDNCGSDLFFIWPMVVCHKIDENSPLYGISASDLIHQERFEIVVILEGTVESTGQTTQARSSYLPSEILWGHRFEPVVSYNKEKQGYEIDYSKFNSTLTVDTVLCSARELADYYKLQDGLKTPGGKVETIPE